MKIYNTLGGKLLPFKTKDNEVKMYVCGPTVYDLPHLGHGRSAVVFDVIRRYFLLKGFKVKFATNYTDVDDKIINRARERKITEKELCESMIKEYESDYASLGIPKSGEGIMHPKATENIPKMVEIVKILEDKGFTYVLDDGVYFDVTRFKDYGKLSGQKMDSLQAGARVAVKDSKKNPQDFVLWKFSKPGEPVWNSPWGDGRPGWHIECSAMINNLLGHEIDFHGGGADLTFPHHECEIAQSEAAFAGQFVRFWVHNGFVQINQEKMSKSLGNFFTLRDIFNKSKNPQALRLLFIQTHYRSPIEFSDEILDQAKNSLSRLHDFWRRFMNYPAGKKIGKFDIDNKLLSNFKNAMDSDFDTAGALASLFDALREINKFMDENMLDSTQINKLREALSDVDSVLGVLIPSENIYRHVTVSDDEINELLKQRDLARKEKNWAESDRIRNDLHKKGVQVEDSANGATWKRL